MTSIAYNAHARFPTVLDLCNGAISEKNPQIFGPPLPAEYVTVFSGRTDAAEVRCDLTDSIYRNPLCACTPRVEALGLSSRTNFLDPLCLSLLQALGAMAQCPATRLYIVTVFFVC